MKLWIFELWVVNELLTFAGLDGFLRNGSTQPVWRYTNQIGICLASSLSRQDEPNPALWLATRAGKRDFALCPARKNYSLYHRWRLFGQDSWIWAEKKENLAKIQPSWPQALHEGHIVIWQVLIMNKPSSRRGTMSCSGLTSISTDFCQRIKRRRELQHC